MKRLKKYLCNLLVAITVFNVVNAEELKPVLYLSFDKESNPMKDMAGTHKPISVLEKAKPKWIKEGKFGGAIKFDGKDDYWGIKDVSDLNFGPNESFTIELWIKFDDVNGKAIAPAIQKGNHKSSWDLRYHTKQRLSFFQRENGRLNHKTLMMLWGRKSKKWHHISLVRDAKEKKLRLYVDAKLIRETDETDKQSFQLPGRPILLGKCPINKNRFYQGIIDELVIFHGVKRYFDLSQKPIKKVNQQKINEYKPKTPKIETPDLEIAKSWQVLEKYKLNVVPAPKHLKVIGKLMTISPKNWTIETHGEVFYSGIELINKRLKSLDGEALKVRQTASTKNRIIIGDYKNLKKYISIIDNTKCPPPQGYLIKTFTKDGNTNILIAGGDKTGTLYGQVTLALMLKQGEKYPMLYPVEILDWPDFKYRLGYSLPNYFSQGAIAIGKKIIDYALMNKLNVVYVQSMYKYVEELSANAKNQKNIYDYANKRGIRVVLLQHTSVGKAPKFSPQKMPGYSRLYYPYKPDEGLIANSQYSKSRAFTWSRDDLIDNRGKVLANLMKDTGANMIYLHSMDCGGRENPSNWKYRTSMDKKRWGNDRAAAEANLLNRIFKAIKTKVQNPLLIFVEYPYGCRYLEYPNVRQWLKRLSVLMNKKIYFCVREDVREQMAIWMKATKPHPNLIYHEPWPWSYRLFFSPSARYAKTFYFKNRKEDIYYFMSGTDLGHIFRPQISVAAEYAWNTEAPGWGWLPEDRRDMPRADERVPEIISQLLPRCLAMAYGEKAAPYMADAFKCNLSGRLAGNTSQFRGASALGYFRFKAVEAENAVKKLEQAAQYITAERKGDFATTLTIFRAAAVVNKVKSMQLEAREKLANNQITQAQKLLANAKAELDSSNISGRLKKHWVNPLRRELETTSSIKWFREKIDYLKHISRKNIKVGVYNKGWYKGIVYGLNNSAGMKANEFESLDKNNLKKYDAVIFNACKNTGDVYSDWRSNLRKYVEEGGIAIFTHNAVGRIPSSSFARPVFPEICRGFARQIINNNQLTVKKEIDGVFKAEAKYHHKYLDHLTVKPGKAGIVMLVNKFGDPVMVAGKVGKGYAVYTGEIFGLNDRNIDTDINGDNWKMLFHLIRENKK